MEASEDASEIPLFDVIISKPSTLSVDTIRQRAALDAGQAGPSASIEMLIKGLNAAPAVRAHAAVPAEHVAAARKRFEALGLTVEARPVLKLTKMVAKAEDERVVCPACDLRILLTPDRRCPSCLVFVDKVDPTVAMRRRIREQEKKRLEGQLDQAERKRERDNRAAMEESIRAQIRSELEAQYGLQAPPPWWKTGNGLARGSAALLLVGGAAFGAGRFTTADRDIAEAQARAAKVSVPAQALTPAAVAALVSLSQGKALAEGQFAAAAALPPEAGAVDPADSLVNAPAGPAGAELADAAPAAPAAEGPLADRARPRAQTSEGQAPAAQGPASQVLSRHDLSLLTAQLASALAEMGEHARALEVMRTLQAKPLPADDPVAVAAIKVASILVRAHALNAESREAKEKSLISLRADLNGIDDPVSRVATEAKLGAIVSRQGPEIGAVGLSLLTDAGAALRAMNGPAEKAAATDEWLVVTGGLVLAELRDHARAGHWSRAYALETQLGALRTQASSPVGAVRMLALLREARKLAGKLQPTDDLVDEAMQRLAREPRLELRAEGLKHWLTVTDTADHPLVRASMAALFEAAADKPGLQADVFSSLALAYAEIGRYEAFSSLLQRLTQLEGFSDEARAQRILQLRLGGELALATHSHRKGAYDEAEQHLQRVAREVLRP